MRINHTWQPGLGIYSDCDIQIPRPASVMYIASRLFSQKLCTYALRCIKRIRLIFAWPTYPLQVQIFPVKVNFSEGNRLWIWHNLRSRETDKKAGIFWLNLQFIGYPEKLSKPAVLFFVWSLNYHKVKAKTFLFEKKVSLNFALRESFSIPLDHWLVIRKLSELEFRNIGIRTEHSFSHLLRYLNDIDVDIDFKVSE